tara:strand:+ start:2424 stop:3599 length:1176 start_codon:yes stop_codon:yes gene_type:complete
MFRLSRRSFCAAVAALAIAVTPTYSLAADKLKVVATFSVLGDMVKNVAGDHVALTTLVGPDGDAHVFEPTPADARALAKADLVITNGLEFEGWMERLIKASGYKGPVIVATEGVAALKTEEGDEHGDEHDKHDDDHAKKKHDDHDDDHAKKKHDDHDDDHAKKKHDDHDDDHGKKKHDDHDDDHAKKKHDDHDDHAKKKHDDHAKKEDDHHHHHHGEFDPHAWQDLSKGRVYVANIARSLAKADPAHAAAYRAGAEAYDRQLAALHEEIRGQFSAIPEKRRQVVTAHDAFQYFGHAYGIEFHAPLGMSTESEASASDVAALIRQMRKEGIRALFLDNVTDPRLLQQLAREADAVIGGTLYSDSLSPADGPAATYLDMFRHNAGELVKAFTN